MAAQDSNSTGNGRNPIILIGGAVILAAALLLIFGGGLLGSENGGAETAVQPPTGIRQFPQSGPPVTAGAQPYEFTLNDLDGNPVTLSQFSGQPVIINFWATWCGPCRIEMPHLQAAFEQHQAGGLVILALDQDEARDEVAAFFFDEFGLTFTPLLDENKIVAQNYGLVGTLPTSVFINPNGEITAVHRGPMVAEQIEDYLADTLPDQG